MANRWHATCCVSKRVAKQGGPLGSGTEVLKPPTGGARRVAWLHPPLHAFLTALTNKKVLDTLTGWVYYGVVSNPAYYGHGAKFNERK